MLNFPLFALKCLDILKTNGYEAYFVGGCVRDAIMGRKYDDVDITTNATPDKVLELFEHTIPTGIAHGTVTVMIDGNSIEVTTYRTEGIYTDSRHPDCVNFVSNLRDDLSRRDFTVNALAYDPYTGLVDLYGGVDDIKSKTLRAVGVANKRFGEDSLRILRAFRFASVLGMSIEESTKNAAFELSDSIKKVSGERVLSELTKLCCGDITEEFLSFVNTGALRSFGIFSASSDISLYRCVKTLDCRPFEKFALFVSLTDHNIDTIKVALKPSSVLLKLIEFYDAHGRDSIRLSTREDIKLALRRHSKNSITAYASRICLYDRQEAQRILSEIDDIENKNEPYSIDKLEINGEDLKSRGLKGKDIKYALDKALDLVIADPSLNKKETLLKKLF